MPCSRPTFLYFPTSRRGVESLAGYELKLIGGIGLRASPFSLEELGVAVSVSAKAYRFSVSVLEEIRAAAAQDPRYYLMMTTLGMPDSFGLG